MIYGLLNLSFWGYVIATIIFTQITIFGVTVFLHRCQTHRGLEMHPALSHFFRLWMWMTTGMVTKAWVAIHRKHHAKCETEDDPHSPKVLGIRTVLWEGAELYRKEARNQETLDKYGHNTPDDWLERNVYTKRSAKGILVMLFLNVLLFGIPGLCIWAIQMAWIPFFAAGVINGLGHYIGYRNFEVNDTSTNLTPIAVIIGGEELHNNHHTFGSSAKFSFKWWEFDIGWFFICIFKALGLVKVKSLPSKLEVSKEAKSVCDVETVKAVISHRFQVLANYTHDVLMPVLQEERHNASGAARALYDKSKKALIRNDILLDEGDKQSLSDLLADSSALKTVYQYRETLQQVWDRTATSQKELLEALQEWCRQAEATGVKVLTDFVSVLRSYTCAAVK